MCISCSAVADLARTWRGAGRRGTSAGKAGVLQQVLLEVACALVAQQASLREHCLLVRANTTGMAAALAVPMTYHCTRLQAVCLPGMLHQLWQCCPATRGGARARPVWPRALLQAQWAGQIHRQAAVRSLQQLYADTGLAGPGQGPRSACELAGEKLGSSPLSAELVARLGRSAW